MVRASYPAPTVGSYLVEHGLRRGRRDPAPLAVHRLTRLVQDDEVWPMPELREAYLRRVGETRWADLASCPWCL